MFEKEENVADFFFFPESDELLLQAKASSVVNGAEFDDGDQKLFATDLHGFTRIKQNHFAAEIAEPARELTRLGRDFDIS